MSAVTSPIPAWNALMRRVPLTPLLAFLLAALPLTVLSFYFLPYIEYALPRFIWMVVMLLAVFLFQIRSSMEHLNDRYLNSLTSYPINFVALPALYLGYIAFSSSTSGAQNFVVSFLGLATLFYAKYALVHKRTNGPLYNLLTRPGSPLVQFLIAFALVMVTVWALPNPAKAQLESIMRFPAASWGEQLSAAVAKVFERNNNIALSRITVVGDHPINRGNLTVKFYFVTDKPVLYEVTLEDSDPVGTARIEEFNADNTNYSPETPYKNALSDLDKQLRFIKLSPRDILQLTLPELMPTIAPDDITWTADLSIAAYGHMAQVWGVKQSSSTPGSNQTYTVRADNGLVIDSQKK